MCGHVGTIACTCLWKQKGGNVCLSSIAFHFIFIFELGSCVGGGRLSVQCPQRTEEGFRSADADAGGR